MGGEERREEGKGNKNILIVYPVHPCTLLSSPSPSVPNIH
jgi:hypothetical protein